MKLARRIALGLLAVLIIGLAVPYIDAGGYRQRIENALERSLGRKVTVGKVHFNLLTGPGFTVEDVTIHDDPAIGIEPMAYVETLNARVRLTTLWTRSLSFANLRLNNPTVNLSKSDSGSWNFQLLLRDASARAAGSRQFPSIEVRSGRINFKFGDYKTIFYLSDADLDVTPASVDRLDIRFSGQPARTDQSAQNFGRILGRGMWMRAPDGKAAVDANFELERSGISDFAKLLEGHAIGVHGIVASRAHVTGTIDKLNVTGQLRLEDVHRWDLLPPRSGGWDFKYLGTVDLVAQRIELETDRKQAPDLPFLLRFHASEYLSDPKWAAVLEVKEAPVPAFLEVARHMGAALPAGLEADGKVAGSIGFARPGGFQGRFVVHDSSVRFEKAAPLDIQRAEVVINGDEMHAGPSTVALSDGQTAEIEASYNAASGSMDVHVSTRGMNVAELRTGPASLFGTGAVPVLEACRQGTWRGWLRYVRDAEDATWSGAFELHAARVQADGLLEPVRITAANVEFEGPKIAVTQIRGRAAGVSFRGEYRHERASRPARMKLDIPEADLSALEQLFLPSLRREAGFLARFRFRTPAAPGWMQSRNLEANVRIGKLATGEQVWQVDKLHVAWDGTKVALSDLEARQEDAVATGRLSIDLAATAPIYRVEGSIQNLDYRGGTLSVTGRGETRGTGMEVLANATGTGTFSGDELTLSPESDFHTLSGNFELSPGGRLRLTGLQAAQGLESYSGQGSTQPDGRMLLELTSGKRQVRVAVAK